jgi:hypothetical protein
MRRGRIGGATLPIRRHPQGLSCGFPSLGNSDSMRGPSSMKMGFRDLSGRMKRDSSTFRAKATKSVRRYLHSVGLWVHYSLPEQTPESSR